MKVKLNEKNKEIVIFIIILILMTAVFLVRKVGNLDELWNFNFAKNIAEGRLPYRDFNIVQTPLLPIICGIILKIFGSELFVMRIIGIFLNTSILFLGYKILKQLKINNYFIYLSLIGIYFIYYDNFCIDYNFAILLIILITIYLELKSINQEGNILKENAKHDILLGILVGTSILFKQTTGLILSLVFIFYKILILDKKQDWKKLCRIFLLRAIGVLIPIILFCLYLTINNIWYDFLDYAIYGIKTFTNTVPYTDLLTEYGMYAKILSIFVPIVIIYMFLQSIVKEQKTIEQKNIFIFFVYSIAGFSVIIPIADITHFLIACMPVLLCLIYIIYFKLKNIRFNNKILRSYFKEFIKIYSILLCLYLTITSLSNLYKYLTNR